VLVTGAAGYVAGLLLPALAERYDLVLVDVTATQRDGHQLEGVQLVDLLDDPVERFSSLCAGVDVIVHCGFRSPAEPSYAAERLNVDMTARVYEVAAATGVCRVVCTSTNQAAKWYERPWRSGAIDRARPEDYPRPDSFYGWAKTAYETLGFLYATGEVSRPLEVVQIRIVCPRPIRASVFADRGLTDYLRDIAGWISDRDLQQLYVRSIEAASVDDEHGVPFQIFYGVSGNARTFWSITNARRVIGYDPRDDSEIAFADEIAAMLRSGVSAPAERRTGSSSITSGGA
jgi:hypothetical protein